MKRLNLKCLTTLLAVVLIASVFAGCAGGANSGGASSAQPQPAASASTGAAPQENADPFGKYDPPIEVKVTNFTNNTVKYREGESLENNVWTRAWKDMGINVSYSWVVDEPQYFQKMNLTIASGDLPDIFPVSGQQLNTLLETDSIADLTDVYERYISPQAADIIKEDEKLFELGKRDGRLFGIANSIGGSAYDAPAILWVREDWRKKLNLPEPNTMDDFNKLAEAFVTQDPDGNGANDTYAMGLTKTLYRGDSGTAIQGFAGLSGFANAYHAYLGTWINDASGNIAYGSIQPEVKTMLAALQEMYAKGWIDREFAVKDSTKVVESTAGGKMGLEFGQMWNPFYPLNFTLDNDKDADWRPYPVPSVDNVPAKVSVPFSAYNYYVVRKDYEHPEAAIKMLNLFTEKCWGETADNDMFNGDGSDYIPFKYALVQAWPAKKNIDAHNNVAAALKNNDPSALNVEERNYYDQAMTYIESGDPQLGWGANKIFGQEPASFDVINKYVTENLYLYDQYNDIPTPTMVEKLSTLEKMEIEVFTKIIMGASLDEFDTFVENWKKLGGDTITQELNALPR